MSRMHGAEGQWGREVVVVNSPEFDLLYFSVSLCAWQTIPTPHPNPLFSELKDAGFNIQQRGQIEVKGKGQMTTYFLLGNLLVSEDSIMGREGGKTCIYSEELQGQSKKGDEEKILI